MPQALPVHAANPPHQPVAPKPKREYYKPTQLEVEERIRFCEVLLCQQYTRAEVYALCEKKYNVRGRTMFRYLQKAEKNIKAWADKDRDGHILAALNTYRSIIRSGAAARDKIVAQRAICELFGLNAPTTLEHVGGGGGPMQFVVKVTPEELPKAAPPTKKLE